MRENERMEGDFSKECMLEQGWKRGIGEVTEVSEVVGGEFLVSFVLKSMYHKYLSSLKLPCKYCLLYFKQCLFSFTKMILPFNNNKIWFLAV